MGTALKASELEGNRSTEGDDVANDDRCDNGLHASAVRDEKRDDHRNICGVDANPHRVEVTKISCPLINRVQVPSEEVQWKKSNEKEDCGTQISRISSENDREQRDSHRGQDQTLDASEQNRVGNKVAAFRSLLSGLVNVCNRPA